MPGGLNLTVDVTVSERGKPTRYSVKGDLGGEKSFKDLVDYMQQVLVRISIDVLKEEQAQGFDKDPVTLVDNRLNKSILQVRPFGTVEFKKRVASIEVISFIYDTILKRSPVDSGRYIDSHFVFLNGKRIAHDRGSLDAWINSKPQIKPNDFIRIVNVTPYARRLERLGVTRQRTRRVSRKSTRRRNKQLSSPSYSLKPNGVYFLSTRSAKRKYKGNVSIYFGFIPGSELGLNASFSQSAGKNAKPRTYLYPTIKIYVGGKRGVSD